MTDTVKFLLALFIVAAMIGVFAAVGIFAHHIEQVPVYEARVNRVLEEQGGDTPAAQKRIQLINKKFAGQSYSNDNKSISKGGTGNMKINRGIAFSLSSGDKTQKPYGSEITYTVHFATPIIPGSIPVFNGQIQSIDYKHSFTGVTTSKVSPTNHYGHSNNDGSDVTDDTTEAP